ncbi:unnamed protein product [Amoebophrya sp. A120]|nr:unnamed protein product [Amoebophrya sp. A120]|eukprot:GSA120T00025519001.1
MLDQRAAEWNRDNASSLVPPDILQKAKLDALAYCVRRNFGGISAEMENMAQAQLLHHLNRGTEPVAVEGAEAAESGQEQLSHEHLDGLKLDALLQDNLQQPDPDGKHPVRYPLIMPRGKTTGSLGVVNVLQAKGILEKEVAIVFGSSFPEDGSLAFLNRCIDKVKHGLESGEVVVLVNAAKIYEAVYDALNQYYTVFAGQKYVNLGLGNDHTKVQVASTAKLVILEPEPHLLDTPLLNRMEKYGLSPKDLLTHEENEVLQSVRLKLRAFIPQHMVLAPEKIAHFSADETLPLLAMEELVTQRNKMALMMKASTTRSLKDAATESSIRRLFENMYPDTVIAVLQQSFCLASSRAKEWWLVHQHRSAGQELKMQQKPSFERELYRTYFGDPEKAEDTRTLADLLLAPLEEHASSPSWVSTHSVILDSSKRQLGVAAASATATPTPLVGTAARTGASEHGTAPDPGPPTRVNVQRVQITTFSSALNPNYVGSLMGLKQLRVDLRSLREVRASADLSHIVWVFLRESHEKHYKSLRKKRSTRTSKTRRHVLLLKADPDTVHLIESARHALEADLERFFQEHRADGPVSDEPGAGRTVLPSDRATAVLRSAPSAGAGLGFATSVPGGRAHSTDFAAPFLSTPVGPLVSAHEEPLDISIVFLVQLTGAVDSNATVPYVVQPNGWRVAHLDDASVSGEDATGDGQILPSLKKLIQLRTMSNVLRESIVDSGEPKLLTSLLQRVLHGAVVEMSDQAGLQRNTGQQTAAQAARDSPAFLLNSLLKLADKNSEVGATFAKFVFSQVATQNTRKDDEKSSWLVAAAEKRTKKRKTVVGGSGSLRAAVNITTTTFHNDLESYFLDELAKRVGRLLGQLNRNGNLLLNISSMVRGQVSNPAEPLSSQGVVGGVAPPSSGTAEAVGPSALSPETQVQSDRRALFFACTKLLQWGNSNTAQSNDIAATTAVESLRFPFFAHVFQHLSDQFETLARRNLNAGRRNDSEVASLYRSFRAIVSELKVPKLPLSSQGDMPINEELAVDLFIGDLTEMIVAGERDVREALRPVEDRQGLLGQLLRGEAIALNEHGAKTSEIGAGVGGEGGITTGVRDITLQELVMKLADHVFVYRLFLDDLRAIAMYLGFLRVTVGEQVNLLNDPEPQQAGVVGEKGAKGQKQKEALAGRHRPQQKPQAAASPRDHGQTDPRDRLKAWRKELASRVLRNLMKADAKQDPAWRDRTRDSLVLHPLSIAHDHIAIAAIVSIVPTGSASSAQNAQPDMNALMSAYPHRFEELLAFHTTRMEQLFKLLSKDLLPVGDGGNVHTPRALKSESMHPTRQRTMSTTGKNDDAQPLGVMMRKFEFWLQFHLWAFLPGLRAAVPPQTILGSEDNATSAEKEAELELSKWAVFLHTTTHAQRTQASSTGANAGRDAATLSRVLKGYDTNGVLIDMESDPKVVVRLFTTLADVALHNAHDSRESGKAQVKETVFPPSILREFFARLLSLGEKSRPLLEYLVKNPKAVCMLLERMEDEESGSLMRLLTAKIFLEGLHDSTVRRTRKPNGSDNSQQCFGSASRIRWDAEESEESDGTSSDSDMDETIHDVSAFEYFVKKLLELLKAGQTRLDNSLQQQSGPRNPRLFSKFVQSAVSEAYEQEYAAQNAHLLRPTRHDNSSNSLAVHLTNIQTALAQLNEQVTHIPSSQVLKFQAQLHQGSLAVAEELLQQKLDSNLSALPSASENGEQSFLADEARQLWQDRTYGRALQGRILRLIREKSDLSFLVNLLQRNDWLAVGVLDERNKNGATAAAVVPDVFGGIFHVAADTACPAENVNYGAQPTGPSSSRLSSQQATGASSDENFANTAYVSMNVLWTALDAALSEDNEIELLPWLQKAMEPEIRKETISEQDQPFWRAVRFAAVQRYVFHHNVSPSPTVLDKIWEIIKRSAEKEKLDISSGLRRVLNYCRSWAQGEITFPPDDGVDADGLQEQVAQSGSTGGVATQRHLVDHKSPARGSAAQVEGTHLDGDADDRLAAISFVLRLAMVHLLPQMDAITTDHEISLLHALSPTKLTNYDNLWLPGMSGSEDIAAEVYTVHQSQVETKSRHYRGDGRSQIERITSIVRHRACRRFIHVGACGGLGNDDGRLCTVCGGRIGGGHGEMTDAHGNELPADDPRKIGTLSNELVYGTAYFIDVRGIGESRGSSLDALREEGPTGDVLADNDGIFDRAAISWQRHSSRARRSLPEDRRESALKENDFTPEEDLTRPETVARRDYSYSRLYSWGPRRDVGRTERQLLLALVHASRVLTDIVIGPGRSSAESGSLSAPAGSSGGDARAFGHSAAVDELTHLSAASEDLLLDVRFFRDRLRSEDGVDLTALGIAAVFQHVASNIEKAVDLRDVVRLDNEAKAEIGATWNNDPNDPKIASVYENPSLATNKPEVRTSSVADYLPYFQSFTTTKHRRYWEREALRRVVRPVLPDCPDAQKAMLKPFHDAATKILKVQGPPKRAHQWLEENKKAEGEAFQDWPDPAESEQKIESRLARGFEIENIVRARLEATRNRHLSDSTVKQVAPLKIFGTLFGSFSSNATNWRMQLFRALNGPTLIFPALRLWSHLTQCLEASRYSPRKAFGAVLDDLASQGPERNGGFTATDLRAGKIAAACLIQLAADKNALPALEGDSNTTCVDFLRVSGAGVEPRSRYLNKVWSQTLQELFGLGGKMEKAFQEVVNLQNELLVHARQSGYISPESWRSKRPRPLQSLSAADGDGEVFGTRDSYRFWDELVAHANLHKTGVGRVTLNQDENKDAELVERLERTFYALYLADRGLLAFREDENGTHDVQGGATSEGGWQVEGMDVAAPSPSGAMGPNAGTDDYPELRQRLLFDFYDVPGPLKLINEFCKEMLTAPTGEVPDLTIPLKDMGIISRLLQKQFLHEHSQRVAEAVSAQSHALFETSARNREDRMSQVSDWIAQTQQQPAGATDETAHAPDADPVASPRGIARGLRSRADGPVRENARTSELESACFTSPAVSEWKRYATTQLQEYFKATLQLQLTSASLLKYFEDGKKKWNQKITASQIFMLERWLRIKNHNTARTFLPSFFWAALHEEWKTEDPELPGQGADQDPEEREAKVKEKLQHYYHHYPSHFFEKASGQQYLARAAASFLPEQHRLKSRAAGRAEYECILQIWRGLTHEAERNPPGISNSSQKTSKFRYEQAVSERRKYTKMLRDGSSGSDSESVDVSCLSEENKGCAPDDPGDKAPESPVISPEEEGRLPVSQYVFRRCESLGLDERKFVWETAKRVLESGRAQQITLALHHLAQHWVAHETRVGEIPKKDLIRPNNRFFELRDLFVQYFALEKGPEVLEYADALFFQTTGRSAQDAEQSVRSALGRITTELSLCLLEELVHIFEKADDGKTSVARQQMEINYSRAREQQEKANDPTPVVELGRQQCETDPPNSFEGSSQGVSVAETSAGVASDEEAEVVGQQEAAQQENIGDQGGDAGVMFQASAARGVRHPAACYSLSSGASSVGGDEDMGVTMDEYQLPRSQDATGGAPRRFFSPTVEESHEASIADFDARKITPTRAERRSAVQQKPEVSGDAVNPGTSTRTKISGAVQTGQYGVRYRNDFEVTHEPLLLPENSLDDAVPAALVGVPNAGSLYQYVAAPAQAPTSNPLHTLQDHSERASIFKSVLIRWKKAWGLTEASDLSSALPQPLRAVLDTVLEAIVDAHAEDGQSAKFFEIDETTERTDESLRLVYASASEAYTKAAFRQEMRAAEVIHALAVHPAGHVDVSKPELNMDELCDKAAKELWGNIFASRGSSGESHEQLPELLRRSHPGFVAEFQQKMLEMTRAPRTRKMLDTFAAVLYSQALNTKFFKDKMQGGEEFENGGANLIKSMDTLGQYLHYKVITKPKRHSQDLRNAFNALFAEAEDEPGPLFELEKVAKSHFADVLPPPRGAADPHEAGGSDIYLRPEQPEEGGETTDFIRQGKWWIFATRIAWAMRLRKYPSKLAWSRFLQSEEGAGAEMQMVDLSRITLDLYQRSLASTSDRGFLARHRVASATHLKLVKLLCILPTGYVFGPVHPASVAEKSSSGLASMPQFPETHTADAVENLEGLARHLRDTRLGLAPIVLAIVEQKSGDAVNRTIAGYLQVTKIQKLDRVLVPATSEEEAESETDSVPPQRGAVTRMSASSKEEAESDAESETDSVPPQRRAVPRMPASCEEGKGPESDSNGVVPPGEGLDTESAMLAAKMRTLSLVSETGVGDPENFASGGCGSVALGGGRQVPPTCTGGAENALWGANNSSRANEEQSAGHHTEPGHPTGDNTTDDVDMSGPKFDGGGDSAPAPEDSSSVQAILDEERKRDIAIHPERLKPNANWSTLFASIGDHSRQEPLLEYRVVLQPDGLGREKTGHRASNGRGEELMYSETELQWLFAGAVGTFVDSYIAEHELEEDHAQKLKQHQSQIQNESKEQLLNLSQSSSRVPFLYNYQAPLLEAEPPRWLEQYGQEGAAAFLEFRATPRTARRDPNAKQEHQQPAGASEPSAPQPASPSNSGNENGAALAALHSDFYRYLDSKEGKILKTEGECGRMSADEAIIDPQSQIGDEIQWYWLDTDSTNNTCGMNSLLALEEENRPRIDYAGQLVMKLKIENENPRERFARKIRTLCRGDEANLARRIREIFDEHSTLVATAHPAEYRGQNDVAALQTFSRDFQVAERVEQTLWQIVDDYHKNHERQGHNIRIKLLEYDSVATGWLTSKENALLRDGHANIVQLRDIIEDHLLDAKNSFAWNGAKCHWNSLRGFIEEWAEGAAEKLVSKQVADLLWENYPPRSDREELWKEYFLENFDHFVDQNGNADVGRAPPLFARVWDGVDKGLLLSTSLAELFPRDSLKRRLVDRQSRPLLESIALLVLWQARFQSFVGKMKTSAFQVHRRLFANPDGDAGEDLFTLTLKQYLSYVTMPGAAFPHLKDELQLPAYVAILMGQHDLAAVFDADQERAEKRGVVVHQENVREAMAKWRYATTFGVRFARNEASRYSEEEQRVMVDQLNHWKKEVYETFAGWRELQHALKTSDMHLVGVADWNHFRSFVLQ